MKLFFKFFYGDWAGYLINRSTLSLCFKLDEFYRAISWLARQKTVNVTAETEFNSIVEPSTEVFHLSGILEDLGMFSKLNHKQFCRYQALIVLGRHTLHYKKS